MILVDANLVIYAYHSGHPHHVAARSWLEDSIGGSEPVGFAVVTLLAFLRISTDPRIHREPLSTATAIGIIRSWLDHPNVRMASPTEAHWRTLQEVSAKGQARGPLLMDAHLAALAIEHGATLATTDRDFSRFPGLRTMDPVTAARAR